MKKTLILAAAAVLLAVGFASNAFAICGITDNRTFGQLTYACGGNFCYVVGPNPGVVPAGSSFWGYTTGNADVGLGNDNGTWKANAPASDGAAPWCRAYGPGCYMSGTWAATNDIDGCIAGTTDPEVMLVQFSDFDGTDTWYATSAKEKTVGQGEFEFSLLATDITLVPLPKPVIAATDRDPDNTGDVNTVEITISAPDLTTGCYTDGAVLCADVASFQVFKQVVARDAGVPTDRAIGAWTAAAAAGETTFRETCADNSDIYLAIASGLDSGYNSDWVGPVSTVIQCGPTIADPNNPGREFRIIDRQPKGKGNLKK